MAFTETAIDKTKISRYIINEKLNFLLYYMIRSERRKQYGDKHI